MLLWQSRASYYRVGLQSFRKLLSSNEIVYIYHFDRPMTGFGFLDAIFEFVLPLC